MAISDISLSSRMRSSLLSLQHIAQTVDRTQERLSTGRKVNSALDNPTNFFTAQAYLNRASDLLGRKDSVQDAIQNIAAANRGITGISSLLATATGIATSALATSNQATRTTYSLQFDQILAQIDTLASDSGYNGTNLLKGDSLTVEFAEISGDSTLVISGVDATSAGLGVDLVNSASGGFTVTTTTSVSSNIVLGGSDPVVINGDGTVTAVSNYGGVPQPAGLTGVVSVASGPAFTMALKDDGTVVGWGDNTFGQVTIPAGLVGVTAIATGNDFSMALKSDGTVVAWGDNTYGQLNTSGLTGVTAIAAGYDFALALKSDGTVVGWGDNTYGQTSIPSGLTGITAISAGNDFGLALKSDGTVVGWGDNSYLQTDTSSLSNITAISAGVNFALALDSNGDVFGWGDNSFNQIDIPILGNVVAISAGVFSGLALDDTGTATEWVPSIFTTPPPLTGVKTTTSTVSFSIPSNSWSTTSGIQTSLDQVENATDTLHANSKQLASDSTILTTRLDFITTMSNTLKTGADNLTLADMNEEGANMLMLQTRQSLATNSLSIGAQSAQAVLRLF